jgi:hypothetical protein
MSREVHVDGLTLVVVEPGETDAELAADPNGPLPVEQFTPWPGDDRSS